MLNEEFRTLHLLENMFPDVRDKMMIFISKGDFTETVRKRAKKEGAELAEVGEMFE